MPRISLRHLLHVTRNRAWLAPVPLLDTSECQHYFGNHIIQVYLIFFSSLVCSALSRTGLEAAGRKNSRVSVTYRSSSSANITDDGGETWIIKFIHFSLFYTAPLKLCIKHILSLFLWIIPALKIAQQMIKPPNKDDSPLNAPSLPFIITMIFQWSSHTLSDPSAWTQVPMHSYMFKYASFRYPSHQGCHIF